MPIVAILPVKSFRLGKGRMAEEVEPAARMRLGQALAERTAGLAADASMVPVLVAGDADVAEWALTLGLPCIADPGQGLDEAAAAGVAWADASSSSWLVLHTDLPLLTGADLNQIVLALDRSGWAIAPSSDGGTSALGGRGEVQFGYGPGSFRVHLGRCPRAEVVSRPGLLHDLDWFADLESARHHPRGLWLNQVL